MKFEASSVWVGVGRTDRLTNENTSGIVNNGPSAAHSKNNLQSLYCEQEDYSPT